MGSILDGGLFQRGSKWTRYVPQAACFPSFVSSISISLFVSCATQRRLLSMPPLLPRYNLTKTCAKFLIKEKKAADTAVETFHQFSSALKMLTGTLAWLGLR